MGLNSATLTQADLRTLVAAAILSRQHEFQPAFPGVDIADMAQQLEQGGQWQHELADSVMHVLSRLLCIRIRVVFSMGQFTIIDNTPEAAAHKRITLVLRANHYNGTQ